MQLNSHPSGRHFLQIPGPTNVPDRILRAIDHPTIDHRGPEFNALAKKVLRNVRQIFQTKQPVVIYPASGTGAWEAALVNTLSAGDTALMWETGHFASLWKKMADRLGIKAEFMGGDWHKPADPAAIEQRLREDKGHAIKAVCIVHNETSTGVVTDVSAIRQAIDAAKHPALLMVDAISSLGSLRYQHDAWGVDVTIAGSQKGMMLPPGLSFNAISEKALAVSQKATTPRAFWNWEDMLASNANGWFPYTPATNLLYGLNEACDMLLEEGLDAVFARHARHGEATRTAVRAWGLEILCSDPKAYSNALTAIVMPEGHDADALRKVALENFNMSLGQGLTKVAGKVFRIGHLGDFNDLMLMGSLSGIEMALGLAKVPHKAGGAQAALTYLRDTAPGARHG